jgi:hypothetical protein
VKPDAVLKAQIDNLPLQGVSSAEVTADDVEDKRLIVSELHRGY